MKKNIFLALFFLLGQYTCIAQQTKPKFTSINQFGVVWGATDDALHLQTINGFAYKTFSAGLGVGLDYYWERTVPLFIDLRKDVFGNNKTPYVYADLGVNMPWVKTSKDELWYKSNYGNGSYFDVGLGYKIPIKKGLFANISFGYTHKTLKEERTSEVITFDIFPGRHGSQNYLYTLRRFSLKAGLSF